MIIKIIMMIRILVMSRWKIIIITHLSPSQGDSGWCSDVTFNSRGMETYRGSIPPLRRNCQRFAPEAGDDVAATGPQVPDPMKVSTWIVRQCFWPCRRTAGHFCGVCGCFRFLAHCASASQPVSFLPLPKKSVKLLLQPRRQGATT